MAEDCPILHLAAMLRVAHHVPGRIRLRFESGGGGGMSSFGAIMAEVRRFVATLKQAPGVRSVDVNLWARSCTIAYDPDTIPADAWPELLDGGGTPAADALLESLRAAHLATADS
jgi:hypothetical protein